MYKEKQILKYQDETNKVVLIRLATPTGGIIRYQIRHNRRRIETTISEYQARRYFAQMVQNIVLQLKIY